MSDVAIIAPAIDVAQLEREIQREHIALQDGERKESSWSEANAKRRVALGQLLIKAKQASKHGTWLPFLQRCGVPQRTAHDWMLLAGFVESKLATAANFPETPADALPSSPPSKPVPTYADAGIDKRPRKAERAGAIAVVEAAPPKLNDLEAALMHVDRMIMKYAQAWPSPSRRTLAQTLRSVAERIERMAND